MQRSQIRAITKYLLQSALLGVAYFGVARWTLANVFEVSTDVMVPVWPASGLAAAVLAVGGYRLVLGVAIGAFLGHAGDLVDAIPLGIGPCGEALLGAFLLRLLLRPDRWLSRPRDLPALGLAAGLSASAAATFAIAALCLLGSVSWSEYGAQWLRLSLGDAFGIFLVAPSILIVGSRPIRLSRLVRSAGSLVLATILAALSGLVFGGGVAPETAASLLGGVIPVVLWMVFRDGRFGAAVGVLIVTFAALTGTAHGLGPFSNGDLAHGMYHLWVFLSATTLAAFLLAAVLEERHYAQQTLLKNESMLRAFYDNAPANMGILELTDDDLLFISCNRSAAEFFGTSPGELCDRYLGEFRTQEQLEEWVARCREASTTGQARRFEFTRVTEKGKRTLLAVVGPVKTEPESAPRLAFAVQDVTEHRATEMERDRFFEQALDMLFIGDFEGRILRANPAFCRKLGYTHEELRRLPLPHFFHAEDLPRAQRELVKMAAGVDVRAFESRLRKKNGKYFWVVLAGAPDLDHGVIYGIGKDITEQRQVAEALQAAKDAADAAAREKSQFLANVTHELRTPLSAIIGMAGLLKVTQLDSSQREYVDSVNDCANSLLCLVNQLLDFSKLEAHKVRMELEPFSLRSLVGHTVKLLAPQAHQKSLELAYRVAPTVPDALIGDPGKLQEILVNLVANALKFTDTGEVVIRVSRAKDGAELDPRAVIHFQVSDTGIGIPPSKQSLIFRAFVQADGSTTRRYGGTGLGLTISAQLVALMGGRIWLESEPERGSAFHFTAPLWLQDASAGKFEDRVPPILSGRRVLVVDDSAVVREILESQLRDWEMEPLCVADTRAASSALERAETEVRPFNLLLLDETLVVDVGLFLDQSRRGVHATLPSILMVPTVSARPPVDVARHGVAGHLAKPLQPSHLKKTMALVLEGDVLEHEKQVETGTFDRPTHTRPLRILVAEDDAVNRTVVVRILRNGGHDVYAVENGRQALEAYERESFDAVLLDVQMVELDGVEVSRIIRSRERGTTRHIPIVASTALLREEEKRRCIEAGMDAFLAKPVEPDHLYDLLERVAGDLTVSTGVPNPPQITHDDAALDREALFRRAEGDLALVAELARMFLEDYPKTMNELHDAVLARDGDRVRRLLHRLSGSLETLGAQTATDAARRLSHATRRNQVDWESTLTTLQHEMQRLETALVTLTKERALL